MDSLYQEGPTDSWSDNGIRYKINEILKISHTKDVVKMDLENFRPKLADSKKKIDGQYVCGSCYDQVKNLEEAYKNHKTRTKESNINIPIIVFKDSKKWRGVEKAFDNGLTKISVKILDKNDLQKAKI